MLFVHPSVRILQHMDYMSMLHVVCTAVATCYDKEVPTGQKQMESIVSARLKAGHESVIEHVGFSALLYVDRGITHELVRHRLASFTQASTRFIDHCKSSDHIPFVLPPFLYNTLPAGAYKLKDDVLLGESGADIHLAELPDGGVWALSVAMAENGYKAAMQAEGSGMDSPEMARAVLPNSLMAKIVITANMREWRHIFALRALGSTGRPHPQMQEVMLPLLEGAKSRFPVFFSDM